MENDELVIRLPRKQLLYWSVIALFAVIIYTAAIMEDPYITYRVVDNFVRNGTLSWALDERVQPSTSPLWLLVHIPFYWMGDVYFVSLMLCLLCTLAAIVLPLRTFKVPAYYVVTLFLLPLGLSAAFVKYSTSGFENALQHALFAWTGWILFRASPKHFWLLLTASVSLSLVNRLDSVIFYAPLGLYLLATRFKTIRWGQALLGTLPIVLWELFSLFYYGTLFPNSKYAKLASNMPSSEYWRLGESYVRNLFVVDTVSAIMLTFMCLALPVFARRWLRGAPEDKNRMGVLFAVALGAMLYALYVVVVGGTYLGGRLFSLSIFTAAWIALATPHKRMPPVRNVLLIAMGLVLVRLLIPDPGEMRKRCWKCFTGINLPSEEEKKSLRDVISGKFDTTKPRSITWHHSPAVAGSIGMWGYAMKPEIKIIDFIAITDPLLSRLPTTISRLGSMGSVPRRVPDGYVRYFETGSMSEMDPSLVEYYTSLRLITSGDLWSMERLREIVHFNLGAHDEALARFIASGGAAPVPKGPVPTPPPGMKRL